MSNMSTEAPRSEQSTPHMSPTQPYPPMQPPYRSSPTQGPINSVVSLPPLRHLSRTPPTPSDRRHGNPFGVHAMLNPQADLVEQQQQQQQQRNRGRSASQMESPSPVETQHSNSLPSISRPTSVDSTREDQHPPRMFQPPGRPSVRHLLSPKSQKLHRTQSLGMLNPPTGTIDAHQSPFLTASTRPSESINHQPALPTPPAGGRSAYFSAVQHSAPTPPPTMVRHELRRPSVGFPQSGSASPIAQYSPYSQAASVASSQYDNPTTQGQYPPGPAHVHLHDSRHGSIPMETERNSMIPRAPSSQSSIQLMTIKSQHGQVQIPVDVQAASKVADEKRRRNAGASARFRARRKEKEREASMSISRLEQQLRDALEDAEYYRRERDYFKTIVFQQPNPERHYARPPSPRLRRLSVAPSLAPSSTTGPGSDASYGDYEEEDHEEERNVRRRTSNYHPVSGPPPTDPNAPGPSPQSYATPAFPPVNLPSVHSPHHAQQYLPPTQGNPGDLQPPSSERPSYRDAFDADATRYERSTWAPGPAQPRPH